MSVFHLIKDRQQHTRPQLAVCSKEALGYDLNDIGERLHWNILPCRSLEEVLFFTRIGSLDAVALRFDPFDDRSRENFLRLAANQSEGRPFVVSYSDYNPSWIENLVSSVGSNLHVNGTPNVQEVIKKMEKHFRYAIDLYC